MAADAAHLDALYPAVAAVVVAVVGLLGTWLVDRRKPRHEGEDALQAMAEALAAAVAARKALETALEAAERRAIACEAREQARRRRE